MDGDIVIRGGTLVDGTGRPRRAADVALAGGRVAEIGEGLSGDRELDASGQVVAPGFIDIHTHYDAQVFWDPSLTPSSFHGVTTVVAGNCGFSIAPVRPDLVGLLAGTLQHVEDMSFDTLSVGVPWAEFETFPQYLDAIERQGGCPELRLLRRSHRCPSLCDGSRGLQPTGDARRARPNAGHRRRIHGRRCHRVRVQRLADP